MKLLAYIPLILASLLALQGCGDKTKFTIEGHVTGDPSMNLYMRYYSNNKLNVGVTVVNEGKFEFAGSASEPTLVEIMDNDRKVLGRVYLNNGDNAKVEINRSNPLLSTADSKQNDVNKRWTQVLNENADSLAKGGAVANRAIERYVEQNPNDMVSSLLFVTLYNFSIEPLKAQKLAESIGNEVRIASLFDPYYTQMAIMGDSATYAPIDTLKYRPYERDTLEIFTPAGKPTLILMSDEKTKRKDSILPELKEVLKNKKVRVLDLVLVQDTSTWKRLTRRDTVTWTQGWAPGGIYARGIDRLGVPSIPYFIVVDTAGQQRYRGVDLTVAADSVRRLGR